MKMEDSRSCTWLVSCPHVRAFRPVKKVNSHGKPPELHRDNTHGLHGGRFCALLIMKIKIKKDEDFFSNIRQRMVF